MGGFLTTAGLCCCEQQAHTDTAPCCPQCLLPALLTHFTTTAICPLPWCTHTHTAPPQGHHRLLAGSLCSVSSSGCTKLAELSQAFGDTAPPPLFIIFVGYLVSLEPHLCHGIHSGLQLTPATDMCVAHTHLALARHMLHTNGDLGVTALKDNSV